MIEAVILYSSNDSKYFKHCIENLLTLNIPCHVITYTHMWMGTPENMEIYEKSHNIFKHNPLYHSYLVKWTPGQTAWYWEYVGRNTGIQNVKSEYTLLIDIDEIVDIDLTKKWIDSEYFKKYDTLKLGSYQYWREPQYKSDLNHSLTVMVKTELAKKIPFGGYGREPYFQCSSNSTWWNNFDNFFIDHYSWIRTKEEWLNKVKNWGHHSDKTNWVDLVEAEFSREFDETKTDFLYNANYTKVQPKYNFKII